MWLTGENIWALLLILLIENHRKMVSGQKTTRNISRRGAKDSLSPGLKSEIIILEIRTQRKQRGKGSLADARGPIVEAFGRLSRGLVKERKEPPVLVLPVLLLINKMKRKYICIAQMDYIESLAVNRLKQVISGEQGGVSIRSEKCSNFN